MKTILIITALTLNVLGQGQVNKEYFNYAPVVVDVSGQKMHKITVHTRSYESGSVEIQYSRNLFHWYPIIFFTPPTQVDDRRTGASEIYFTNSNFGMRESQSRVFFRRVVDPEEVDYEGDFVDVVRKTILAKIRRSNPDTDRKLFLDYESLSTITRNPTNILNQMEGLTGLVAWNSRTNGKQFGGVLVTPRHLLCSAHAIYSPGDKVWFVDRSNNVYPATITVTIEPYPGNFNAGDYAICLLDEELPDVIEPVKVLPLDAYTKFDSDLLTESNVYTATGEKRAYAIYTNQDKEINITRVTNLGFGDLIDQTPDDFDFNGGGGFNLTLNPEEIEGWKAPAIPGDSGNPFMVIYRRQLVLFGSFTTSFEGPFFGNARNLNDLQRMIEDVRISTGDTLDAVDLRAVRLKPNALIVEEP